MIVPFTHTAPPPQPPEVTLTATVSDVPGETVAYTIEEPWHSLAGCESDWRWSYNGDSGYDGGLQFAPSTWTEFKPDGYPTYAWQATPQQQVTVAELVLDVQGWMAWPSCSEQLGLR